MGPGESGQGEGHDAAAVTLSITTLDGDLARRMEPRAAQPGARLAAISALFRPPTGHQLTLF